MPGVEPKAIEAELKTIVGAGVEVAVADDPNVPTPVSPLRPDVVGAYTASVHAMFPAAPVIPQMSTGATDGKEFRAVGIPIYGVDGGWIVSPDDERAHGRDERLPVNSYHAIVAKDVLAHVPDYVETVTTLHRALKPGGLLVTNFDTRPVSKENAWHLYDDDLPLRRSLQNIGFEQIDAVDGYLIVYRGVRPTGLAHLIRRARNAVLFGPPRRLYRRAKVLRGRARS